MSTIRLHCLPRTPPAILFRTTPTIHTLTSLTLFHSTSKLRLYATSTTAVETLAATSTRHPWPEWVSFVDRLKSLGYILQSSSFGGVDSDDDRELMVYRELRLLKEPCLSFARDRYDVFKSLSKDDIKNIVEVGCPKLVRKVVNSAKRLRLYVGLEEKNVCDACSLRGSCDRAYFKPNETESVRNVDIMRLLLFYALDPMVISEAKRPTSINRAESSARRLLSIIMDLSEASNAPASGEPTDIKEKVYNSSATVVSEASDTCKGEWCCPKCSFLNYSKNTRCCNCNEDVQKKQESAPVELKRGYWNCPQCKILNYAKNIRCRQCNEGAPKKREKKHAQPKFGDWHCCQCNFLNYSRNMKCRKCNEDAPEKRETRHVEPKKGDWDCPQCQFINFASRSNCLQCTAIRPPQSLNTGEWVCSKCYYLNFRRNVTCLKCDGEQVKDVESQKQHVWTKPTPTTMS